MERNLSKTDECVYKKEFLDKLKLHEEMHIDDIPGLGLWIIVKEWIAEVLCADDRQDLGWTVYVG